MENLHMTYDEVMYKYSYRQLLIMQKDKLHVVYGEIITRISGKEMAQRRGKLND